MTGELYIPQLKLYMNNDKYISGDNTNENPVMLVYLRDNNGINSVGNGFGHEIIATLDNNSKNPIVLNDYYSYDIDSYTCGKIQYPFKNLREGKHILKLKVWDTFDNSSEVSTEFVVVKSSEYVLNNVRCLPNPFKEYTEFTFEDNRPDVLADIQIQIYTISGLLIKTIRDRKFSYGYMSEPIKWDGQDDLKQKVNKGVYLYKLRVRSLLDNSTETNYGKLIIMN